MKVNLDPTRLIHFLRSSRFFNSANRCLVQIPPMKGGIDKVSGIKTRESWTDSDLKVWHRVQCWRCTWQYRCWWSWDKLRVYSPKVAVTVVVITIYFLTARAVKLLLLKSNGIRLKRLKSLSNVMAKNLPFTEID